MVSLADTWLEVLKAMRSPTDEMVAAAVEAYDETYGTNLTGTEAVVIWQAMIDAAVNEPPNPHN